MRAVVVVEVGEGVDAFVQAIEAMREVVAGVELVAPGALGTLDMAIELGPLRWSVRYPAVLVRRSITDRWFQPILRIVGSNGRAHLQALDMNALAGPAD